MNAQNGNNNRKLGCRARFIKDCTKRWYLEKPLYHGAPIAIQNGAASFLDFIISDYPHNTSNKGRRVEISIFMTNEPVNREGYVKCELIENDSPDGALYLLNIYDGLLFEFYLNYAIMDIIKFAPKYIFLNMDNFLVKGYSGSKPFYDEHIAIPDCSKN